MSNSGDPLASISDTYRKLINEIDISISACLVEIKNLINKDEKLCNRVEKLETIKGVGFVTVAIIIAETKGFDMIVSRKQLASYAGLDVIERQSGQRMYGKTRISKKGNSHIRAALYFPAMVASKHNPTLKEDYQRIVSRNPKQKKSA